MTAPSPPAALYLLRHAHSGWPAAGMRDFDRTLDARGREEAELTAMTMVANGLLPDVALCSPARRCVETLEALRERTAAFRVVYAEALYTGDETAYLDLIAGEEPACALLVVGHNPTIGNLAAHVTARDTGAGAAGPRRGFPTGALLVVDLKGPLSSAGHGHGTVRQFLAPQDA